MIIGGLEKLSLLDFPERLSAVIFTQGCNFRCHFCYNPMLVWPSGIEGTDRSNKKGSPLISEESLFAFLKERQGKLEGVVITGGEPTLHHDLPEFIEKIRQLGYAVKLDTNGTNPEMVKKLAEKGLLDYIAMDLKGPLGKYGQVTGVNLDFNKIQKSVKIIMESGIPYEFRTTVVPGLLDVGDISKMGEIIRGADKWFLQKFKSEGELVDKKFIGQRAFTDKEMAQMEKISAQYAKQTGVR